MMWIIFFLAKYPDIQQKVHDELSNELGTDPLNHDDMHKLRFQLACDILKSISNNKILLVNKNNTFIRSF